MQGEVPDEAAGVGKSSRKEQLLQAQAGLPLEGGGVAGRGWGWVEGAGWHGLNRPFIEKYKCFVYSKSDGVKRERASDWHHGSRRENSMAALGSLTPLQVLTER